MESKDRTYSNKNQLIVNNSSSKCRCNNINSCSNSNKNLGQILSTVVHNQTRDWYPSNNSSSYNKDLNSFNSNNNNNRKFNNSSNSKNPRKNQKKNLSSQLSLKIHSRRLRKLFPPRRNQMMPTSQIGTQLRSNALMQIMMTILTDQTLIISICNKIMVVVWMEVQLIIWINSINPSKLNLRASTQTSHYQRSIQDNMIRERPS
jgi:hypothetical protein